MGITVKDIAVGDVFSEGPHFKAIERKSDSVVMLHIESGQQVVLQNEYVEKFLDSADQVDKTVKVGKEDKFWTKKQIEDAEKKGTLKAGEVRVGDLREEGIRTIFEKIYTGQVFTAVFQKADVERTKKVWETLLKEQADKAAEIIEKTASAKKGVAEVAKQVIADIQRNYIAQVIPGEDRTLRGFKVQFKSRDGRYDCVDMDIDPKDPNVRPININTLKSLSIGGIHYEVV